MRLLGAILFESGNVFHYNNFAMMRLDSTSTSNPAWASLVWFVVCLAHFIFPNVLWASEKSSTQGTLNNQSEILWENWEAQAFNRAKAEDKLILLDLTAIWCHACHVMDETTYIDSQVVALLNTSFIPVRVETDQRPDIEARYKYGGWPTTSILLPSGEILYQANLLPPEEMLIVLEEIETLYRENKHELLGRATEVWKKVEAAKKSRVRHKAPIEKEVANQMMAVMKQSYDPEFGGFRDAPKFFEPEAIAFAFQRYYWQQDLEAKRMALVTLDQQIKLFDPVWGGFYRYAEKADWTSPHYEKMLSIQAYNLLNYLEAYQITEKPQYRKTVETIIQYVSHFLADENRGGFFASQDADFRKPSDPNSFVPGKVYFALNASERVKVGLPYTDRSIYTGWNGLMAKSYLKASQVLDRPELRDFALKTLNRLFDERYQLGKGMAHVMQQSRPQAFGLLDDQVWYVDALLEAYIMTGQFIYRDRAIQIVREMVEQLEDRQGGGFFDRPKNSVSHGLLKFPYKDLKVNVSLVRIFSDLFYITQDMQYQVLAKKILQFVLSRPGPLPVGSLGLAITRVLQYPVHIVVVGEKQDSSAKFLLKKARQLYVPGKLVRFLDPHVDTLSIGEITFPQSEIAQAFVCTDKLCSSPIQNAEGLSNHLNEVMAGLLEASDPFP